MGAVALTYALESVDYTGCFTVIPQEKIIDNTVRDKHSVPIHDNSGFRGARGFPDCSHPQEWRNG